MLVGLERVLGRPGHGSLRCGWIPDGPAAPGSHLGELKERIDSTGELNIEEQIAIVCKLKEEIRVGRSPDEARGLLRRLRERNDQRAKVAKEIEAALLAVEGGSATYGLAWFGAAIWSAIDAYKVASGKSSLG